MASSGYVAIDKTGKEVKGSIEADSVEVVKAHLKQQGFLPVTVSEQSLLTKDISLSFGGHVKVRDLSVMCRQFVSMIKAGVSILDA